MQLIETLGILKQLKEKRVKTNHGYVDSNYKVEKGWKVTFSDEANEQKSLRFETNDLLVRFVNELEFDASIIGENKKSELPAISPVEQEAIAPINSLSTTLLETIEKLKADPGYVKQADAICRTSNSLIHLTSLHLKVIKSL